MTRWTEADLARLAARKGQAVPFAPPENEAAHYAKGQLPQQKMNKLEAEYAQRLEIEKKTGAIIWYKYEGIKLRLADNTFYTPDFFVLCADGFLEVRETKGGWFRDDAKVKIKIAASMYPFRFFVIRKTKNGWDSDAI